MQECQDLGFKGKNLALVVAKLIEKEKEKEKEKEIALLKKGAASLTQRYYFLASMYGIRFA